MIRTDGTPTIAWGNLHAEAEKRFIPDAIIDRDPGDETNANEDARVTELLTEHFPALVHYDTSFLNWVEEEKERIRQEVLDEELQEVYETVNQDAIPPILPGSESSAILGTHTGGCLSQGDEKLMALSAFFREQNGR